MNGVNAWTHLDVPLTVCARVHLSRIPPVETQQSIFTPPHRRRVKRGEGTRERESVVRIDTSRNAVDVCEIGDAIGRYTRYRVYATANRERERVRGVIFPFFFEFIFFHNTRKR